MSQKERRDTAQTRQGRHKKGKRMYDETKTEETGEGPLYPPEGGSYIHN